MTFKRVSSLLIIALAVLTLSLDASARKFGGGKSFGKSFRTAPQKTLSQRQNTQPGQSVASNPRRTGMMGGLMGGLLAGGLFAWLLGSGAFQGLQMMDVLILAVIAFIGFRILRGIMQAKAMNTAQSSANATQYRQNGQSFEGTTGGTAEPANRNDEDFVPFDLPQGFDISQFLEGARGHYNILQTAWNQNDLAKIREYMAPELYQVLVDERAKLGTEVLNNQILYVDASLVRAQQSAGAAQVSVHFRGKYSDTQNHEHPIDEIWHLRRELDTVSSDWLIEGIEERGE
ncbi:Tim44 domain-containing protein [Celerinatantimonas diazotrophica]|uniref:Putative lipid-binding transport protein (Tim44 family) n=2 Tax=Celerinatantimonas diazotrophica TaxID=412034 RepID=A0A4R1K7S0_9GAMM|nr:Tim44-like domain-containing protein [Celerinatantimonas diazotrophica]TCK60358.1 putative lipid-binding transport protein (Tim44 family) [Celerinatantimonas diazotrophica]